MNGATYTAGTKVHAIAQVEVTNDTTGETGFAQIFGIGGSSSSPSYLAYPFSVSDGDSLTFIATDNGIEEPYNFGDTQGYAYSDFDAPPVPDSTIELTTTATDETGQSGSFTDTNTGATVDYTITGAGGASAGAHGIDASNVWLGNGTENPETLDLSFTTDGSPVPVDGVVVKFALGNTEEVITFKVNGVEVDLNTLIASGDVTFTPTNNAFVTTEGGVGFNESEATNIETLTFNIPISTLEIVHPGGGNGLLVELFSETTVNMDSLDPAGTPPESPEAGVSIGEAIFLGNFMDADISEEFFPDTVNTAPFLGTFGSSSDPLWQDEVLVTYEDVNGDGVINTDNASPQYLPDEEISYDLGSGTQTALVDSIVSINLTVTYTDGSTQSYTNALMYQDDAGNMFLVNSDWAGTNLNSGSWPQIQSIDVTSVTDGYHGAMTQDDFQSFVCFTRGTLIKTDQGERPIEELAAGDMVLTMDHGYQPTRWIGSSKRAATGDLAPILIRKGALGNDRDLRVSPQHRMLLQGWQAEMLFGELEVLATAKSLLNDQTILRDEGGEVEYFHMLFDTHEIIYAEGCPSESFHPGQQGWKALDQATRDEILTLFPQLADGNFNDYGPAARMSLKHKEGKLLGSYMAGSV
ncbi:type I secretion target repeat protein [Thalassobium sp. R2A62]|nr:type I secretion target repeat protein [Thalassobium sp. R2A62]